jgi:hypothetical protein
VDPGHRHLFTAVNTGGSCTCFSNNEWYQKAGFAKRRRNQQKRKRDQNIDVIESSLPTKKILWMWHFFWVLKKGIYNGLMNVIEGKTLVMLIELTGGVFFFFFFFF